MRTTIMAVGLSVLLVFSFTSVSGDSGTNAADRDLTEFYGECIENKISSCDGKGGMWDSRSENLRRGARLAILKASFYSTNKEKLVKEMLARGVEAKPYKVNHYLNKRFYESLSASYPPDITLSLTTTGRKHANISN